MASVVYYRFRSQRESQRLTFDGPSISVWDLKREIILRNKLGKGTDFDLGVFNADTDDEYRDDNYMIPRSTHVTVRRLPASRPGRGTAQLYVADLQAPASAPEPAAAARQPQSTPYRGPMSMRFDGREQSAAPVISSAAIDENSDEASRIAAMFQATSEQWGETQEKMAHATFRERAPMPRRGAPSRPGFQQPAVERPPPPPGYVCYRCGKKGHWIQECPNGDKLDADNRPRFKPTTGIPKSMLKTIEQSIAETMTGVMVTPDGSYVVATPDSQSWNRSRARSRPLSQTDVYQSVPADPSLACPLCSKLIRDAVITPCCQTTFCEECVQTHLFEHDFLCPECEKPIRDISTVKIDDVKRKAVREYVANAIERSEAAFENAEKGEEGSEEAKQDASEAAAEQPKDEHHEEPKEEPSDEHRGHRGESEAPSDASAAPGMPAGMPGAPPMPQFNPQYVQQLVMMLQNPQLPMPMRMQLQMQLQMQQFLFFQSFSGQAAAAAAAGAPGMPGTGSVPKRPAEGDEQPTKIPRRDP
ncbi:Protein mpe1 [Malassezia cuniculi]|uniref:Protein mpe1 n=1 Tax=Malassezia cuniculi TaxID=948313 RepID=A0AAF0ESK1_9BASI|nr:Protein mpe1 [Malassezia cuniculi]